MAPTGQTEDTGIPVWVWLAGAAAIGITVFAFTRKGTKE
jgi:hypothetical protein